MRIAVAGFEYEGNSFSNVVDGRAQFADKILLEGPDLLRRIEGKGLAVSGAVDVLRDRACEVVPIYAARGGAGGYVERQFANDCMDRIVDGIRAAMPIDGVYLALHGAMLTEDMSDPEGELLARVHAVVGQDVPIAASLDLHAHVTAQMVEAATILVGYQTYPHEDAHRTGAQAARLLVETLDGTIRPRMALHKLDAILPVLGGATTGDAPMAQVAAMARVMEQRPGMRAVSYFPVQPWLDAGDVGIAGLAIADDAAQAELAAEAIVHVMWERRHAFELKAFAPRDAVRQALSLPARTVLIVDAPDSIGAGAPGDNVAVMAAILAEAPDVDACVYIVDAPAVRRAQAVGVGATVNLPVGATRDARYTSPVEIVVTVERVIDDATFIYAGGPARGARGRLGAAAILRCGGLRILVAINGVYEYGAEHYAACGIDIDGMRLVSCKNLMNFRTLLGPGRDFVAVHGPGASPLRLQDVAWRNKQRPFWPMDDVVVPKRLA